MKFVITLGDVIAEDVEQRVFGIVASLLGMKAKEEGAVS